MRAIESFFVFIYFLIIGAVRWCVDASWDAYLIGISVLMAGLLIAGAIADRGR